MNREELIKVIDGIERDAKNLRERLPNLNNHTLKQQIEILRNGITFMIKEIKI